MIRCRSVLYWWIYQQNQQKFFATFNTISAFQVSKDNILPKNKQTNKKYSKICVCKEFWGVESWLLAQHTFHSSFKINLTQGE